MAIKVDSRFECPVCGTERPTTDVPYDALGYAVCPDCEIVRGPGVRSLARRE